MITARVSGTPIRIRVLCVGTNSFPLRFAEQDARNVAAMFAKRYGLPGAHARILVRPTRARLQMALREIAAERPDVFVFYDSSHGSVEGIEVGNKKLFRFRELAEAIRVIAAKHTLVVLDTCHSGAFTKVSELGEVVTGAEPPSFLDLLALATPSIRVLCSVPWNQNAGEGDGINAGHLTAAMLQAGATASGNLFGWIDDEEFCDLTCSVSIARWNQHPVTRGLTGNFPLLRRQPAGTGIVPIIGTSFLMDGSLSVSVMPMERAGMPTLIRAELENGFASVVAAADQVFVPTVDSEIVTATFPVPQHLIIADPVSAWRLRRGRAASLTWRFYVSDYHDSIFDEGRLPFIWAPSRAVG